MRSPGLRQRLGTLAVTALAVSTVALPRVATPALGAPADDIAAKRAEAAALATELESLAITVSRLAEEHNQAQLKAEQVEADAAAAQQALDQTERDHRAARARLRQQAIDAYVRGGNVALESAAASTSPSSVDELSLRRHYVQQVVRRQRTAVEQLRAVQAELADRKAALDDARASARRALDEVAASRSAASRATAAQRAALARAEGELASLVRAEADRRAAEEARRAAAALAERRAREDAERRRTTATTTPSRSTASPSPAPTGPAPAPSSGAAAAVAEAKRQLGKPYEWGGSGPNSFDCSGLTAWAWRAGGKSLPHSSQSQFSGTARVDLDDLAPGDLLFYGNPIHHVGIYVGDGQMIEAPETGKNVRYASIARRDYVGAGRVR